MEAIIIAGCGGHGKVVVSLLKKLKKFKILGYIDQENKGKVLGIPYLGSDWKLKEVKAKYKKCNAVIGIGSVNISDKRRQVQEKLVSLGFPLPAVISPDAIVNEAVTIGEGTVVMDGVVINSGTKIGKYCIINTRASIDHDCAIGDFVHIAPGATLSGGVVVGEDSFIGAGSTVIQYKKIVKHCLIGAGSSVITDCLTTGTYLGCPAKKQGGKVTHEEFFAKR